MISPFWHRALPLLFTTALSAADNDARDQLIRQLDQRAFGMLEQRAKTVAAIITREAAEKRRAESSRPRGDRAYEWLLSVLVPAAQLRILPYNRVVRDIGGRSSQALLAELSTCGTVRPASDPVPPEPGIFCFYLDRGWWRLDLPGGSIDRSDPVRSLDVSLLQERVLEPVLGIVDQRTDPRIDFVGGIRGTRALEAQVDAGLAALAISLYPTTVEQVMAVADRGHIMPPKSTWFEPKLRDAMFCHLL